MNGEILAFIVYFVAIVGVGIYFFFKEKGDATQANFFLGGRQMGPWVAAMSAQASDMSAWLLMGLPGSILAFGFGQMWIGIGLALGTAANWIFVAKRLRKFSSAAGDAITVPQYLGNRFLSKSNALQVICAIIFFVCFTIYVASAYVAGASVFTAIFPSLSSHAAMIIFALAMLLITFFGGFKAVCWTDFFQGMLVLGSMFIAPIFAAFMLDTSSMSALPGGYLNPFSSWQDIVSGLAWGLGYFGMPHIIIRFMSIKSQKDLKKSAKIGITWTLLIVFFATLIGVIGRLFLGFDESINENSLVFIQIVRKIFPGVISGILLSAVLAASMSTADSQLLAASSAFSSDVYKPVIRKGKASDKEMMWTGRIVVLGISVAALIIASNPNAGSIMALVSNAWGIFGAAFGPAIMLSLFWKRFNFKGAVAGIITGAAVDILWYAFLTSTGIYELLPGFVLGLIAAVVVTLCTNEPSKEVYELFDKAEKFDE